MNDADAKNKAELEFLDEFSKNVEKAMGPDYEGNDEHGNPKWKRAINRVLESSCRRWVVQGGKQSKRLDVLLKHNNVFEKYNQMIKIVEAGGMIRRKEEVKWCKLVKVPGKRVVDGKEEEEEVNVDKNEVQSILLGYANAWKAIASEKEDERATLQSKIKAQKKAKASYRELESELANLNKSLEDPRTGLRGYQTYVRRGVGDPSRPNSPLPNPPPRAES
jgi:hypothetical protein